MRRWTLTITSARTVTTTTVPVAMLDTVMDAAATTVKLAIEIPSFIRTRIQCTPFRCIPATWCLTQCLTTKVINNSGTQYSSNNLSRQRSQRSNRHNSNLNQSKLSHSGARRTDNENKSGSRQRHKKYLLHLRCTSRKAIAWLAPNRHET